MKTKRYNLIAWLMGAALSLTACQSVEAPYNNIPTLNKEVGYQLNVEDVSNVKIFYRDNINPSQAYFLISESENMQNARKVPAERNENGTTSVNLIDLKAATTYYFTFHHYLDHGDVESTKGSFTTYRYAMTPISVSTNYSNIRSAGFYIFNPEEKFADNKNVNCEEDMKYVPGVRIMNESTVYLYRPWQEGSFSYEDVPVSNNLSSFEYGQVAVTPPNPDVTCEMKNLAYRVILNVKGESSDDMISVKEITGLEIANADGITAISNSGTCNIATGVVTPKENQTDKLVAKMNSIPLAKKEETVIEFRSLIPASFKDNEVKVNVDISDNNNMTIHSPVYLPSSEWIAGNSYEYDIVVIYTRNAFNVVITNVSVQPWTNGGYTKIDIED